MIDLLFCKTLYRINFTNSEPILRMMTYKVQEKTIEDSCFCEAKIILQLSGAHDVFM